MKNIFAKSIAIAAACVAFSACNLDVFPADKIVYHEGEPIFKSQADIDGFRTGIYVYFRSLQGGSYAIAEELMFDNFNATLNYGNNYGSIHTLNSSFNASNEDVLTTWAGNYLAIDTYNVVINAASNVADELKESAEFVKGEALVARAYSYLQLARHFGPKYNEYTAETDLCVPLVTVSDLNAKPARATVKQVYDQIKSDLDTAITILEKAGAIGEASSEYFTADFAKALRARYYLDIQDYENAAKQAVEIIGTKRYPLARTADELTELCFNDNGTEALMQLYVSKTEAPNSFNLFSGYAKDSNKEAVGGYSYNPLYIPSKKFIDSYSTGDIRRNVWLTYTDKTLANLNNNYLSNIYIFSKFLGNKELSSSGIQSGLSAPKPVKIGEMYLIAAESYLADGNSNEGKKYFDTLCVARNAGLKKLNDENLHAEWNRETVGDGLVLSNMKRWESGFTGRPCQTPAAEFVTNSPATDFVDKKLEPEDRAFVWPIPTYELRVNPNLVQNNGYAATK